jgi:hypothetical protein
MKSMKSRAVAVFLMLAYLAGSAATGRGQEIPADVIVVAPDATIPKEVAAFSGTWAGTWNSATYRSVMAEQIIVVDRISSPTSAHIVYAGIGRYNGSGGYSNYGRTWLTRVDGTFANNTLQFTLSTGTVVTCSMNGDGTLAAAGLGGGNEWRGTFSRRPNPR